MKNKLLLIAFLFLSSFQFSGAQSLPAIVQDWATEIGYTDTIAQVPLVKDDSQHVFMAGFTVDSITGPDILVSKMDTLGNIIWTRTYSGDTTHAYRDQASCLAIDG
jgi:hypothetical protein